MHEQHISVSVKSTAFQEKNISFSVKSTAFQEKNISFSVKPTAFQEKNISFSVKSTAFQENNHHSTECSPKNGPVLTFPINLCATIHHLNAKLIIFNTKFISFTVSLQSTYAGQHSYVMIYSRIMY